MKATSVPLSPRTSVSEYVLPSTPASAKSRAFQPKLQMPGRLSAIAVPPSGSYRVRRSEARLEFLRRIELIVERRVHHIEHAPRARHADGPALFEAVDGRHARLVAGQPVEDIDDLPTQLFLPDAPEAGESRHQGGSPRTSCHDTVA